MPCSQLWSESAPFPIHSDPVDVWSGIWPVAPSSHPHLFLQPQSSGWESRPASPPGIRCVCIMVGWIAGQRVQGHVWVTCVCPLLHPLLQIVVCTSDLPDAGTSSEVWLVLQGEGGSSARVALPSAAGDFGRGREDVFRLALAGVGAPQRLTVGVVAQGQAPAWHLEQVEVTEEATGGRSGGLEETWS